MFHQISISLMNNVESNTKHVHSNYPRPTAVAVANLISENNFPYNSDIIHIAKEDLFGT